MDVRVRCLAFIDGKIIMIHRVRPDKSEQFYFFPGGGVDEGELPESACVREMLEEAALTVEPVKLLGIQLQTDSVGDHCQMYFLVKVLDGELGKGDGLEYTEALLNKHGTHDPVAISIEEFCDTPKIHPGRIREQLLPYLDNILEIPFFLLDDRKIC